MKKSKINELYLKCPIIFSGHSDEPKQNLMCFGFECGDGWFELISELSLEIESKARQMKESGVTDEKLPLALQVKEKFGTLHFYIRNASSEIAQLITVAEQQSARICEVCSNEGTLRRLKSGWFKTLCNKCERARLSTPLESFDELTGIGKTMSGSKYKVIGPASRPHSDALILFKVNLFDDHLLIGNDFSWKYSFKNDN